MINQDLVSELNPYGIEKGVIPYPEECVFVVVGGLPSDKKGIAFEQSARMLMVARTRGAAFEGFLHSMPGTKYDQWQLISCRSLADLRAAQHLESSDVTKLDEPFALRLLGKREIWWIEDSSDPDKPLVFVSAYLAKTVRKYLMENSLETCVFSRVGAMDHLIGRLEAARDGRMEDGNASYCIDLRNGDEALLEMKRLWEKASPGEKKQIEDRHRRLGLMSFADLLEEVEINTKNG